MKYRIIEKHGWNIVQYKPFLLWRRCSESPDEWGIYKSLCEAEKLLEQEILKHKQEKIKKLTHNTIHVYIDTSKDRVSGNLSITGERIKELLNEPN